MNTAVPFWKSRPLEELSPTEWESLCDGCGRCCLYRIRSADSPRQHHTDVACRLLNRDTGRCGDYANRLTLVPFCGSFTPKVVRGLDWLPATCGYRLVANGEDLAWWHPLISGDPETVHQAGISVRGRAIPEEKAGKLEYHAVAWPAAQPGADGTPPMRWRARFGGVNADLLTPLQDDLSIDLDRMTAHAFRVLELGCDALRVFGEAGEGHSFSTEEIIAALTGLVSRGVPASKLMPMLGGAIDAPGLAETASALGCRAAMIPARLPQRSIDAISTMLPIYMDASKHPDDLSFAEAAAGMGRIQGILASGPDGPALAARFTAAGIEVLCDDTGRLPDLLAEGGAGCISAIANIAPRLPAYICLHWEQPPANAAQGVIDLVEGCLKESEVVPGLKALLARQTGDAAWLTVRPPLHSLTKSQREQLEQAYDRARARPSAQ